MLKITGGKGKAAGKREVDEDVITRPKLHIFAHSYIFPHHLAVSSAFTFVLLPFTNIHGKGGFILGKTTVVFEKTSDVSGKTLDVFGKTSDVLDGCFGWGNGRKKCAKKSEHEIWNNKSEEWNFFSFLKIYNILIFNYLQLNRCVFAP